MENKIHLSQPPTYNHQSCQSNAIYYRSNVDHKPYIILIQSTWPNERISRYDIQNDKYIPISPSHLTPASLFPLKFPKLTQIITKPNDSDENAENNSQLLTICTNKSQLAALDLDTLNYTPNYQSISSQRQTQNINKSFMLLCPIILSVFLCTNSVIQSFIYGIILYFISTKVTSFTHKFEKDIKCVIPHFEVLHNIESCYVPNDSIHFIANNQNTKSVLTHIKFDIKSRQFIELKPIVLNHGQTESNTQSRTESNTEHIPETLESRACKIVYIEFTKTLIMFTNTENVYYFDLNDTEVSEWRVYEDIQLPKIPGNGEWELNIVVGFKGIIFLFYYRMGVAQSQIYTDLDSDSEEDECVVTYCWDLLFTGDMFECDNRYLFDICNNKCVAVNTDHNYTHFIGENPLPFHFKISLTDEIPVELSIIHLQYFHLLIKQYILNTIEHEIPNVCEMLILDYFPMFL